MELAGLKEDFEKEDRNEIERSAGKMGAALSGGYQLELGSHLGLDFHAAVGYARAEYDKYTRIGEVNVRQNKDGRLVKDIWGLTHLGVSLVWRPFNQ